MYECRYFYVNLKPPQCWLKLVPQSGWGFSPLTNSQIDSFPRGMESDVFVWTDIPRDPPSFGVMDTYKGVRNYKYRALINRREGLHVGWILEDICESVRCCVASPGYECLFPWPARHPYCLLRFSRFNWTSGSAKRQNKAAPIMCCSTDLLVLFFLHYSFTFHHHFPVDCKCSQFMISRKSVDSLSPPTLLTGDLFLYVYICDSNIM